MNTKLSFIRRYWYLYRSRHHNKKSCGLYVMNNVQFHQFIPKATPRSTLTRATLKLQLINESSRKQRKKRKAVYQNPKSTHRSVWKTTMVNELQAPEFYQNCFTYLHVESTSYVYLFKNRRERAGFRIDINKYRHKSTLSNSSPWTYLLKCCCFLKITLCHFEMTFVMV